LGKQLAETIPDSVIIESDLRKVTTLISQFGPDRVKQGTGASEEVLREAGIETADALVVTTDDDHVNYLIALIAEEFGVPKIIVRVDDPANVEVFKQIGIETIICPAITAARMISSALYPKTREVREIVVMDESPLKGKGIGEMELSEDSMVAAVLRGHHLIKPSDDLIIQKGDHIVVCSATAAPLEEASILSGGVEKIRPFSSILAVVRSREDFSTTVEEAMCLASSLDITLTFAVSSEEIKEELMAAIKKKRIKARWIVLNTTSLEELAWTTNLNLQEMDCVVTHVNEENKVLTRPEIVRLITSSKLPVLSARGRCPYRKVLTIMEADPVCEESALLALKLSMLTEAELHVLNYRDPEDVDQERMLHIKRVGKMYDTQVSEEVIDGNPTVELVSKVASGDYDLVVVNWRSRVVKKDVIRRLLMQAPMSVLVYNGP